MTKKNTTPEITGSKADTRWKPGQSGNPRGKPKGCRNRATQLADQMIGDEAEKVVRKVLERALEGDTTCLRLCLERIAPPLKERPLSVTLPAMEGTQSAVNAMRAVLAQVSSGALLPGEGAAMGGLVEAFRKCIETEEFETRIAALEQAVAEKSR